jgi:FtsP/CotA-like multicopper oxidase with cupredoxin domain
MVPYDVIEHGVTRRAFLHIAAAVGAGALAGDCRSRAGRADQASSSPSSSTITIRIAPMDVEVAPHQIVRTVGYNDSVPAPVLRLPEGRPVTVEVLNETDVPELVHWHGQLVPSVIDGAVEEGTPYLPPHGRQRYTLTPTPAGTRWLHSHARAGISLQGGMYTGQFGIVYVEPRSEPGRYDREVFLATHEWHPSLVPNPMGEMGEGESRMGSGVEVGYRLFSINGKALGHGEPVRVKYGERVMFRILNASATESIQLALPGHEFLVVALDGNPVPAPQPVRVLSLGVAERIDALVQMNRLGVWILGSPDDRPRNSGLGIVVEYAGASGPPRWIAPAPDPWDYFRFGRQGAPPQPDETIPMVFRMIPGGGDSFDRWMINDMTFEDSAPIPLHQGRRYRLALENLSDDRHPVHLHRHLFELARVQDRRTGAWRSTTGLLKDTVLIEPRQRMDVDFVADNPGLSLFHCHHQLHMNFGFARLFRYA